MTQMHGDNAVGDADDGESNITTDAEDGNITTDATTDAGDALSMDDNEVVDELQMGWR